MNNVIKNYPEWIVKMGLEEIYDNFLNECDQIARECEEEGYHSHGSNYDLRVAQLEQDYPELFGDDE